MPAPNTFIHIFLSVSDFFSRRATAIPIGWDSPSHLYYFSDVSLKSFVRLVRHYQMGANLYDATYARNILGTLANAEEQNRAFWMPEGCTPGSSRNIEEYENTFQNVLARLRIMGARVPVWAPSGEFRHAHWNWATMKQFINTTPNSSQSEIVLHY